MALRLIELILPADAAVDIEKLTRIDEVLERWDDSLSGGMMLVRMLVRTEQTEALLDQLESRFGNIAGFRVILLPIEATLPRVQERLPDKEFKSEEKISQRISREELYTDIVESAKLSRVFLASTVLATLVAAVGLMRDDTAIIIGAMVIAPLLGPNMSLCLATALGDIDLAIKSLRTNAVGLLVALVVSFLAGSILTLDCTSHSVLDRTSVNMGDVVLALAAGTAGVLAFTTGAPSSLIGVMVAVALLPPFAVFGLLLANGEFALARGALMLVATNVICVNLAGVLTFVVQGIRPRTWWEAERATKSTRIAVAVWVILLAILIALIAMESRTP